VTAAKPAEPDEPGANGFPAGPSPQSHLAAAIEATERFPVLADSRDRIQEAGTGGVVRTNEIVGTVESDVGLMIAALRLANGSGGRTGNGVGTVPEAIEMIGPLGAVALASAAPSFELFGAADNTKFEDFRMHALAVQRTADQIAKLTGIGRRDELAVVSMLHDIGHLAISQLRPERKSGEDAITRSPEQRLQDEQEALRIDHALLGGILSRRWQLPRRISVAIEQHHSTEATGMAAHVGLADMIVHYGKGNAFSSDRVETARAACGLGEAHLDKLLREFPGAHRAPPRPKPVRSRAGSSRRCACSPRASPTSRSRPKWISPPRPSAATCTTSTGRWGWPIVQWRSSAPRSSAGSRAS
jgi:HD-like signal output (HDOD) protein